VIHDADSSYNGAAIQNNTNDSKKICSLGSGVRCGRASKEYDKGWNGVLHSWKTGSDASP
jgi:hypothetical protein